MIPRMTWLATVLCVVSIVAGRAQFVWGSQTFVDHISAKTINAVRVKETSLHRYIVLSYSSQGIQEKRAVFLNAPNGEKYRLFLKPEVDTRKDVVVVALVLHKAYSRHKAVNLLEPYGNWHGSQPFSFAARDFAPSRGSELQVDSNRSIDVPSASMRLQIRVSNVGVRRVASDVSKELTYKFTGLILEIASQPI